MVILGFMSIAAGITTQEYAPVLNGTPQSSNRSRVSDPEYPEGGSSHRSGGGGGPSGSAQYGSPEEGRSDGASAGDWTRVNRTWNKR